MNTAHDLTLRLAELLRSERSALAEFLLALAAFHRDERWRELGHTSLFYFLRRELGLSAGAAQHRKTAAELILDFPGIVEPIRKGRLCLSTVCEVQKVLTRENWSEVMPRFFGLSKREAEALVAELQPVEVVPLRAVVTAVRTPASPFQTAPPGPDTPTFTHCAFHLDETVTEIKSGSAPVRVAPPPRDSAVPLTADLRRVHYTVSKRFLDKLDRARDALSHSDPGASVEQILEKGLDLILDRSARRRGLVAKPRKAKVPSLPPVRGSRYVPAEVRRAVWERDGGKCQFKLASGESCGSTYQVEIDHLTPLARGGGATVEELRCACRSHNDEAARQVFGDAWMDRFTRRGRRARESGPDAAVTASAPPGNPAPPG